MKPLLAVLLALVSVPLFADADLVVIAPQPFRSRAGYDFWLNFSVRNKGPDAAPVIAALEFPDELQIVDTINLSACGGSHPVRCQMGELRAPFLTTAQVSFRAPVADATYEISLTLSSPQRDPDPSNNRATTQVTVATASDPTISLQVHTPPLEPGAAFRFLVYAYDLSKPPLTARNVRLSIDVVNATIEGVDAKTWECEQSETSLACFAPRIESGSIHLTMRASPERDGRRVQVSGRITADGDDFNPENNEQTESIPIYRLMMVTSTADDGEGSLRAAIHDANAHCRPGPCRIVFAITEPVPDEGWFTIRPQSPLPMIDTQRMVIDGETQTAFTGDTNPAGPEIFLDGRDAQGGDGISMRTDCDAIVNGLAIGNFAGFGISVFRRRDPFCSPGFAFDGFRITSNYIGTDPTGMRAAPNVRGVFVEMPNFHIRGNVISGNERVGVWDAGYYNYVRENRIGVAADGKTPLPNGASGVFASPRSSNLQVLDNVISYNVQMGVAAATTNTTIHGNSMRSNGGLGIDVGLDGVSPRGSLTWVPNPPTLFAARYDAATNTTTITGKIDEKHPKFMTDFVIGLYANDAPDGDGEEFLGAVEPAIGEDTFTATIQGDLRGRWINAALTRAYWIVFNAQPRWYEPSNKATSELCEAVGVTE